MYVSYDPEICPLYRGVHYRGVSIKRGFTVYDIHPQDFSHENMAFSLFCFMIRCHLTCFLMIFL